MTPINDSGFEIDGDSSAEAWQIEQVFFSGEDSVKEFPMPATERGAAFIDASLFAKLHQAGFSFKDENVVKPGTDPVDAVHQATRALATALGENFGDKE